MQKVRRGYLYIDIVLKQVMCLQNNEQWVMRDDLVKNFVSGQLRISKYRECFRIYGA